jgi:hypothetical protein
MRIIWDWLRLSRYTAIGEAAKNDEVAGVFRASLDQFEELMNAASATGPAARPLPLFYALSQAGRAVTASRAGPDHYGHGITVDASPGDVLNTVVRPAERGGQLGQFQAVSEALGSPLLPGPIPLVALLASLPETGMEMMETVTDRPRPLAAWPVEQPVELIRTRLILPPGWDQVLVVFDEEKLTATRVTDILKQYPSATGRLGLPEAYKRMSSVPKQWTPRGLGAQMLVKSNELDEVAPEYRVVGRRWLRPALDGTTPPPNPLMTWWLVLFTLSILARYHPLIWVRAMDVDSSPAAVTLERAMRKAGDAVPQLLAEAIYNTSMKLQPQAFSGGESPFD